MSRLPSLHVGLLAIAISSGPAIADPKAVVELFTSQGCSSCQAADAYFVELADRSDIIALSLHVDYWDYLGWTDTFGDAEHTERQRAYAEVRGDRRTFTPEIVVNGATSIVGSDRSAVEAAIAAASLKIPVALRRNAGNLEIEVDALPLPGEWRTTIRLVLFSARAEVEITGGENAGSSIVYRNIVREIRPVGMWDGAAVQITLPGNEFMGDGVDGCAVIVQEDLVDGPGAILGAAKLDKW